MFYLTEVDDYVRVEPKLFGIPTKEAVDRQLEEIYEDYYDKELGKVVSVSSSDFNYVPWGSRRRGAYSGRRRGILQFLV